VSIEAIAWALKQRTGSPTLKGVLVAVANYADESGKCWPSQERLCWVTELSPRAVRQSLLKLEEQGFLSRQDRFSQGKRMTDIYTLHFHRHDVPLVPPAPGAAGATGTSDQNHRHVVPNIPAPGAAKPSENPSEESFMRKSRKKIGIEDFRLDDLAVADGKGFGLSDEQIDACEVRFRAYNATNTPQTYAQWCIHWLTWCEKFADKHGLTPKADTSTEVIREGVMLNQVLDAAEWEAWEEYHGRKLPAGKTGSRWFPTRKPPPKAAAE